MKLLGAGNYGCVYDRVRCGAHPIEKDNTVSEIERTYRVHDGPYVTKLLLWRDAEKEVDAARRVQWIDPESRYYLYLIPQSGCWASQTLRATCKVDRLIKYNKDPAVTYSMLRADDSFANWFEITRRQTHDININAFWWMTLNHLTAIAHALDRLHTYGVAHMDVSMLNVMMLNGTIRLIDFGLAVVFEPDATAMWFMRVLEWWTKNLVNHRWPVEINALSILLSRADPTFDFKRFQKERAAREAQLNPRTDFAKLYWPDESTATNTDARRATWETRWMQWIADDASDAGISKSDKRYIRHVFSGADVYMFGLMALRLCDKIQRDVGKRPHPPLFDLAKDVFVSCVAPEFVQRLRTPELVARLDALLASVNNPHNTTVVDIV